MIKPPPRPATVPGGFSIDDFTVDEANGHVTCPGGHTRPISAARTVNFGPLCHGCPLRDQCTTAKDGRTLRLHRHDAMLRAARRAWITNADLRATYRQHRPMVERSIAWLVGTRGRCRRVPYRGVTANNWWIHTRAAALNLRRLLNLGLIADNQSWTLRSA